MDDIEIEQLKTKVSVLRIALSHCIYGTPEYSMAYSMLYDAEYNLEVLL